jgi:drug/metabolite transporter superfamily protein YnfA
MSTVNPNAGRLLAAGGGVLLIVSLFLPWSSVNGATRTGWETVEVWDVFVLITGVCGITAAVTGGRFGFFRPDISFNAMTDMFGVVLTILVAWLILVDFPSGASREVGVYLALAGAAVVATGAGDFRVTSLFPRDAQQDQRVGV